MIHKRNKDVCWDGLEEKCWTWKLHFSQDERQMTARIANGSLILFLITHTHTHTTLQPPLPHAFRFVFDRALNKMRCVCLSVHKQPCVWWFGECHCTRWLSISVVIPVISSQQSQGGPARIPLDDYVCLPYVLLQLLNWFCWLRDKHSNTLFQSLIILFFLRDLW